MDVAEDTRPVGAVAEELGVSVSYLRLAERLGIAPEPKRSSGGHRRYTDADVEYLREQGIGARKRHLADTHE